MTEFAPVASRWVRTLNEENILQSAHSTPKKQHLKCPNLKQRYPGCHHKLHRNMHSTRCHNSSPNCQCGLHLHAKESENARVVIQIFFSPHLPVLGPNLAPSELELRPLGAILGPAWVQGRPLSANSFRRLVAHGPQKCFRNWHY